MPTQTSISVDNPTWFIDSGCTTHMAKDSGTFNSCTTHMAKDSRMFNSLDETIKTRVILGNETVVQAEGKGSIAINTKKDTKQIMIFSLCQVYLIICLVWLK